MDILFLISGQILSDLWYPYISYLYASVSGIDTVMHLNTKLGLTTITCEYLAEIWTLD